MREGDKFIVFGTLFVVAIAVLCAIFLNPLHKKNTEKLSKNKPIDRTKIVSTNVTGNVESIHPWGRTEVVHIKEIELEYFEYCDEWVMYGDVVQPIGRKDYFMPVLKGRLNLNVKDMTQTWVEHGSYATGLDKEAETFEDFRIAFIKVKEGKIIDIEYTHYRLLSNKTWSIIASWKAQFNPEVLDPIPKNTKSMEEIPAIVCCQCKGTGEYPTDINKLMMEASLALFVNHHLMVDKCKKCARLENGSYAYCDKVNDRYTVLLKEYAAAGPKIDLAACSKCMGMGRFSCKKTDGSYKTQEEYNKEYELELQSNKKNP